MPTPPDDHWLWKLLAGAAVSAVVSFVVAYRTGSFFSRQAAQASKKSSLVSILEDIVSKGRRYWRRTGSEESAEGDLRELLDRFFFRLDDFFDSSADSSQQPEIDSIALALHKTLTGHDFATRDHIPSEQIERSIRAIGESLRLKISSTTARAKFWSRRR